MAEKQDQEQTPNEQASPEHPAVKYEPRDVRFRWVLYGAIIVVATGVILVFICSFYFRAKIHSLSKEGQGFPLAPHPLSELPPQPRLDPVERMAEHQETPIFHRHQQLVDRLHGYGSTSDKGFLHVPIKRAMDSLAGQLPVRENPIENSFSDNGLVDSGEPNSGRLFRKAPE